MDCSRIDDSNKFWSIVEKKMGCIVPKYLRNILRLRGFDDSFSVSSITKDDIESFTQFAKTSMKNMIPDKADQLEYYFHSSYAETPENFEIAPVHLKLLQAIVKFINEQVVIHGHEYFNFHSIEPATFVKVKPRASKLNKKLNCKSKKNFLVIKNRLNCRESADENKQRSQFDLYSV